MVHGAERHALGGTIEIAFIGLADPFIDPVSLTMPSTQHVAYCLSLLFGTPKSDPFDLPNIKYLAPQLAQKVHAH